MSDRDALPCASADIPAKPARLSRAYRSALSTGAEQNVCGLRVTNGDGRQLHMPCSGTYAIPKRTVASLQCRLKCRAELLYIECRNGRKGQLNTDSAGDVAQLVERLLCMQEVQISIICISNVMFCSVLHDAICLLHNTCPYSDATLLSCATMLCQCATMLCQCAAVHV